MAIDVTKYLVDTKTPSCPKGRKWEKWALENNKEYSEILKKDQANMLADENPRVDARVSGQATTYHTKKMLMDGKVKVLKTDEHGFIPCTTEKEAIEVIQILRTIDSDVKLSPYGKQFPAGFEIKKLEQTIAESEEI